MYKTIQVLNTPTGLVAIVYVDGIIFAEFYGEQAEQHAELCVQVFIKPLFEGKE